MGPHPPGGSLRSGEARDGVASPKSARGCGLVGDDPQQPGPPLRPGPKPAESAVGLDESLLRGVLGVRRRARDHVGGAKSDLLVTLHDLLVVGRIAALCARDELGIVRWPALHRNASSTPGVASWFRSSCNPGFARRV